MPYEEIKKYAQEVFNYSVEELCGNLSQDFSLNKKLSDYENSVFNISGETQKLLDNEIDYLSCLVFFNSDVKNLLWLKELAKGTDIRAERFNKGFLFPIELVILAEGATEQTLLPEFAKLCDFDFDKNGIFIIPAGGKNQVVKLFYQLSETLKLPIFVLMDIDAQENYEEIKPKLRKYDKVHILKCGEFEDALPLSLIERTLKEELKNISITEPITKETKMVKVLEEIFKHRGMHEFKKAEFAQMVRKNLRSEEDVSSEIKELISEIKNYC
jgi:predicted ATP-dependent endonuclease of OLD family